MGEASSTHLYTAAQYGALLHATSGLTAIAPTQHSFYGADAKHWKGVAARLLFQPFRRSPRQV